MSQYYAEIANAKMATDGYEFFAQHNTQVKQGVRPHIHTAIEMLIFERGEYLVSNGKEEHTLYGGDAVLFRFNELHRVSSLTDNGKYYVVKFSPAFVMSTAGTQLGPSYMLSLSLRRGDITVIRKDQCYQMGITTILERMKFELELGDNFSNLAIKVGVAQLMLLMLRYINDTTPSLDQAYDLQFAQRIYETIAFIEQNYSDDITVENCAERANVSYSYFSRRFKAITGKSFKQYLTDVRLDHAEKKLCSTDDPITHIATDCGFNSMAYFSAVYKSRSGLTPSEAREKLSPKK